MKKGISLSVLLLILGLIWLGCGSDNPVSNKGDHYVEEPFSFTVDVQDQSRFRLVGITGTIEVIGQTGLDSITIAGDRRVGASSTSEAEAHLGDLQIDVQQTAGEVFVSTNQIGDAEGRNYVVDYTITLPPDLEVNVSNLTGTVTVKNMENSVTADVVTGGIILENIHGDADIDVATGMVTLDQFYGSAWVDLITGNLCCRAFLPPEGEIDLKTITGNMNVQIPESTSAELTASVATGQINVSNLPLQNPNISNHYISGQLGDGNGTITLQVVTGSLVVSGFVD